MFAVFERSLSRGAFPLTALPLLLLQAVVLQGADSLTSSRSGEVRHHHYHRNAGLMRSEFFGKPGSLIAMREAPSQSDIVSQDCLQGEWQQWSDCTQSCGGGEHWRTRKKLVEQKGHGTPCNTGENETEFCNTHHCDVQCQWDEWTQWTGCSVSCGGGFQLRSRVLLLEDTGGSCPKKEIQNATCASEACLIDCEWDDWNSWSDCDKECGGGRHSRIRSYVQPFNGEACIGAAAEDEECNAEACNLDCRWSEWISKPCTVSCGGGTMVRQRVIEQQQAGIGRGCHGDSSQTIACAQHACPINCRWSDWSEWDSECSESCGGGSTSRLRSILEEAANGGAQCLGSDRGYKECNPQPCPIDCKLQDWGDWSACDGCFEGAQETRTRSVIKEMYNGRPCDTAKRRLEQRICLARPKHCIEGELHTRVEFVTPDQRSTTSLPVGKPAADVTSSTQAATTSSPPSSAADSTTISPEASPSPAVPEAHAASEVLLSGELTIEVRHRVEFLQADRRTLTEEALEEAIWKVLTGTPILDDVDDADVQFHGFPNDDPVSNRSKWVIAQYKLRQSKPEWLQKLFDTKFAHFRDAINTRLAIDSSDSGFADVVQIVNHIAENATDYFELGETTTGDKPFASNGLKHRLPKRSHSDSESASDEILKEVEGITTDVNIAPLQPLPGTNSSQVSTSDFDS